MDPVLTIIQNLTKPNALIDKNGAFFDNQKLKDCKVFILYFSAHWCPPCRQFTPILAAQYRLYQQQQQQTGSTVIFVSRDRSLQEQLAYMKEAHGDWPALSCQSALQGQMNSAFQVRGIPTVIAVKVSTGEIITSDGRQEIMQNGHLALAQWEQTCVEIDTSIVSSLRDNPPDLFKDASGILLKLIGNILRDPQNLKYRRIRLSNPKIESMLLSANGAFECLFSAGFEEVHKYITRSDSR